MLETKKNILLLKWTKCYDLRENNITFQIFLIYLA